MRWPCSETVLRTLRVLAGTGCGDGDASFNGATGKALLQPGRHSLAIQFPPRQEARGEAAVRLEYVAPP